jgi:hypothetical protein
MQANRRAHGFGETRQECLTKPESGVNKSQEGAQN